MKQYPESLENLIAHFKTLPGIGRRGAERLALALLKRDQADLQEFGELIASIKNNLGVCPECGCLSEGAVRCPICSDPRRDRTVICVVEDFTQLFSIENSGFFQGLYHVLGGKISPLDDEYGENLRIEPLVRRVRMDGVLELIVALGADVEARATAAFLADLLREYPVRISQLAQGLPAGANLAYADGATISMALRNRIKLQD